MTCNEVRKQIVNCHSRLRKRTIIQPIIKKAKKICLYFAHQKIVSCQRTLFGLIIVQTETILIFYDMLSTYLQPQRDKVIIIE